MYIINNNFKNDQATSKNSKFTIVFQGKKECKVVAKKIDLLTVDDRIKLYDAFKGKQAQKLLRNVLDGLIVFLSCKQEKNVISGEFFSSDKKEDGCLFANYIHELQEDAFVDIDGSAMAV